MRPESTAIVTGGARGIGQSICVELARRGADVVVADLNGDEMAETETLVEETGQRCVGVETDVSSADSVGSTVDWVLDEFGSIECLVNNAGIAGPTAPCEDVQPEDWEQTLAVNLKGPFQMCRAVIPQMKQASYGRIVNIASVTGKRPLPNRTPYATSKMGVIGLTRTLAAEVGGENINVNAVCPGSVEGPRIRKVFERQASETGRTYEEIRGDVERETARGELVEREDVADLVGYLCSEQSKRITGQDINVSAGKIMY
ncbi:SDR family NAD(P)-dependent oxidoreductase [Haloarcula marina]|uniref:SDR family NAD(P)-dependent oxidoreductase n=1 Tax=Haloarcula marina TaxID=2961574 RepID=UPI0020B64250|nr:SDR family oxidoreductase [Halomicroarcula marina]